MSDVFDFLWRIFSALWDSDISQVFLVAIVVYFFAALIAINRHHAAIRALVENAPSGMTSLGILGTFVGIFYGLLDFDTQNINQSVPGLLNGLKVAFGTSILGLAAAILFRLTSPLIRKTTITQSATIDDIVESLRNLEATSTQIKNISDQRLHSLHNALTDDKDSSIVGQIQRMRAGLSDLENTARRGFDEQIDAFRAFSQTMSEAFSKAIIDELKDVIREFNEKISEQFGQNFKQLNQAVGQLTTWQEQYRHQMDAMKSDLENTMISIQTNNGSLKEIASSASSIPAYMENLKSIMTTLDQQNQAVKEGLDTFAQIREKAINAFPEIESNIQRITENMRTTVEHEAQTIQSISENCRQITESQKQASAQLVEEFSKLHIATSENTTKITEAMTLSINDQKDAQARLMEGLQKSFDETITRATTSMNESIRQLDEAIEAEISKCVTAMAENLSGITERFVEDYQPLLESTRKIIELAEQPTRQNISQNKI